MGKPVDRPMENDCPLEIQHPSSICNFQFSIFNLQFLVSVAGDARISQ